MADSNTISLNFKLTGEDDMKRGLTDINNALKINQSEMNLVAATYGASTTSIDGLNAKINVLKSTIDTENQKVTQLKSLIQSAGDAHAAAGQAIQSLEEKLAEAKSQMDAMGKSTDTTKEQMRAQQLEVQNLQKELKQAETAYTNTGKQVTNYTTQMNNASAKIVTANKDLENNQQALKKAQSGTETISDKVKSLASSFGVQLNPAVEAAIDKVGKFSTSGAALGLTIASITAVLAKMTLNVTESVEEVSKLSKVTGMSTQSIQELQFASTMLDMDFGTIESSMKRLQKNMGTAQEGTGDAAAAFKDLGVSVTDGVKGPLRDSEDVFYDLIDALNNTQNETKRDADAMAIFGRSADDLNPLILAGSQGLQEYMNEAQQLGLVMGEDTVENFEKLGEEIKVSKAEWQALENDLSQVLLPVLTAVLSLFEDIPKPVQEAGIVIAAVTTVVVLLTKAVKDLAVAGGIAKTVLLAIDPTMTAAQAKIIAITLALVALAAIIAVIIGKGSELNNTLSQIGNLPTGESNEDVGQNASGTQSWRGGPTWAGEQGPEVAKYPRGEYAVLGANGPAVLNLPRGTQIWPNGIVPPELKASMDRRISWYASGAAFYPGGAGGFGENGPELAKLPASSAAKGGDTYYVEINASDVKQISRLADAFDKAKIRKINGSKRR